MSTDRRFIVTMTADFYDEAGSPKFDDLGLSVFDDYGHIERRVFEKHQLVIAPEQIGDANGVIVLTPGVTAKTVSNAEDLLAVGRFGVGYDAVDVQACTDADVVAFITAGAVDRSVAEATLGWMIGLSHHVLIKDKLVREGGWNDRSGYMGSELRDRTLGLVGMGGIARELLRLLQPFGLSRVLVFDPFLTPDMAQSLGVELVELDALLKESDFVSLHCPLTDETRGLIGTEQLSLMKPSAFLLNTARGGIIDEDALFVALRKRRIAGAAIDCFMDEPITSPHRFGELDNVLLAPHSIAWTNELFRDIGRTVCQGMVDLSLGKLPRGVVNPQVLEKQSFKDKWQQLAVSS